MAVEQRKTAAAKPPQARSLHFGLNAVAACVFNARVIPIPGCQDHQSSMDSDHQGAFTEQLLKAWNHGAFKGHCTNFLAPIRSRLPPSQSPSLAALGTVARFLTQEPFTV